MCIRDRAYTDQLERKGCVSGSKISDIRSQISAAEKASGAARNTALDALSKQVDSERGCDAKKIDMLKKSLQDLRTTVL